MQRRRGDFYRRRLYLEDMSDAESLQQHLRRRRAAVAGPIFFHPDLLFWCGETGSTNDDCRRLAAGSPNRSVVVIADRQTAGRGQYGRNWEAPAGLGVLMSFSLPGTPPDVALLSIWGAAAAAMLLEKQY